MNAVFTGGPLDGEQLTVPEPHPPVYRVPVHSRVSIFTEEKPGRLPAPAFEAHDYRRAELLAEGEGPPRWRIYRYRHASSTI